MPTLLTRRLARARRLAGRVWLIIGERAAAPRVRQQRSELLRLLLQPARRARLRVTPLVSLTAHPSADVERAGLPSVASRCLPSLKRSLTALSGRQLERDEALPVEVGAVRGVVAHS